MAKEAIWHYVHYVVSKQKGCKSPNLLLTLTACENVFTKSMEVEGTRCLGSDELVYKKRLYPFVIEMHMVGKMF